LFEWKDVRRGPKGASGGALVVVELLADGAGDSLVRREHGGTASERFGEL